MRSQVRAIEDLRGPAGRLEAVLNTGDEDARFAALVCHPYPPAGGTLHNKVVYHAMKSFHAAGLPVVRFNFRGVGLSDGQLRPGPRRTGRCAGGHRLDGGEAGTANPVCGILLRLVRGSARLLRGCPRSWPRGSRPASSCRGTGLRLQLPRGVSGTAAVYQRRPGQIQPQGGSGSCLRRPSRSRSGWSGWRAPSIFFKAFPVRPRQS